MILTISNLGVLLDEGPQRWMDEQGLWAKGSNDAVDVKRA